MGGKYTEKDGEKSDKKLMSFLNSIDNEKINNLLLDESIKYLSSKKRLCCLQKKRIYMRGIL